MKFVVNVDAKRFDDFAIHHPLNHYSKTSPFIAFKKPEYFSGDLLGVEDEEGKLIASAVMLHKKWFFPALQFSYIQYGFNLDINNSELIRFFAKHLMQYAKERGSAFLRMDFNITRLEHDKDGTIVPDGFNHEYITEILQEEGFVHLGYNYGYSGNWMSRFTYRLDMHDKSLSQIQKGIKRFSTYHNKNLVRDVRVTRATYEDLPILVDSQQELSQKLGFKPQDLSYFQKLWKSYPDSVFYYVVSVNFHHSITLLENEIQSLQEKQNAMKDENKKATIQKQIDATIKEIKEIQESGYDKDEWIPLGAKFILQQGENVWNVNMYTKKTFLNFRTAFALHDYAIEDRYQDGARTYDFEGISGSMDPKDEYYGQTDFKKSFGGDYLEFLGEFDAIFMPKKYEAWKKASRLYSRIRRKLRYLRYHTKKKNS